MAKSKRTRTKPKEIFDCIVVGAGAAGLACARKLLDHGKKVLIVEGRSRIGGRTYTVRDSQLEYPIELGAERVDAYANDLGVA